MATLLVYKGKLALRCSFEQKEDAKLISGCNFDGTMGVWTYPLDLTTYHDICARFSGLHVATEVKQWADMVVQRRLELLSLQKADDATLTVPYADRLRNYQRVGVNFLSNGANVILGDDMGTGKTLQLIAMCEQMNLQRILVVCPNTLKWTWHDEINKWTDATKVVVDGAKRKRSKQIASGAKFTIINYEALRPHRDELQAITWDAKIADEAHKLKNQHTGWTEEFKGVKARMTCLASGTPLLNRPEELWSLLHTLYPDKFSSYWRFVDRYCCQEDTGYGMRVLPPTDHQAEELRLLLAPIMIRRMKSEVLSELPSKVFMKQPIILGPTQRKLYDQMMDDMIVELSTGEVVAAPVVLAKLTRLRQLSISPALVGESNAESAKFDALWDIIENQQPEHKIVVFSNFRKAIEMVGEWLTAQGVPWLSVTGEVKQKDRQAATKAFQEDPKYRVMLATIQAAGLGVTWTAADIAVFLDRHWTPAINVQAEDRLHRMGQQHSVNIVALIAKDTVDEAIECMLDTKSQLFEDIINGAAKVTVSDLRKIMQQQFPGIEHETKRLLSGKEGQS